MASLLSLLAHSIGSLCRHPPPLLQVQGGHLHSYVEPAFASPPLKRRKEDCVRPPACQLATATVPARATFNSVSIFYPSSLLPSPPFPFFLNKFTLFPVGPCLVSMCLWCNPCTRIELFTVYYYTLSSHNIATSKN